jgi:hypothetical protein
MFRTKVVEKIKKNIHFMFNNFLSPENLVLYEIMWKNTVQQQKPYMATECGAEMVKLACGITKARIQTILVFNHLLLHN